MRSRPSAGTKGDGGGRSGGVTPVEAAGTGIKGLLRRYGSPLFVLSESILRERFRALRDAFTGPSRGPNVAGFAVHIAYSYKTNYLPAVCAILHEEGAWAEVVSGMEYRLARALDRPGGEIVLNGPFKSRETLEAALGDGACVNADGFDELSAITEIASGLGEQAVAGAAKRGVGIRVGLAAGASPWSKFGFAADNGDAVRALEMIAGCSSLRLLMLHNHDGTFERDPAAYGRTVDGLAALARHAAALGIPPSMINLGGGFPPDAPLEPYAEAVFERLEAAGKPFGAEPALVLEPGRALVDPAMQLVCTVVANKEIPGSGRALIVDAGIHLLPAACRPAPRHITPLEEGKGGARPTAVHGPLCMPEDVLCERAMLPPLKPGDHLVVHEAGAYTITQSMQFIRPRAGVVLLGPDGPEPIRRREAAADIFALDVLPSRLGKGEFRIP